MREVVVIGGGAAGLAAATFLGRAGSRVTLLERAKRLGGRAASDEEVGCVLNQGPHALYRGGPAMRVLRELGVAWKGTVPDTKGFFVEREGRCHPMPSGALSLLGTSALGFGGKLELAKTLLSLNASKASDYDSISVADWLATIHDPRARDLLGALARVSTYCADQAEMSAGVAMAQIALATKHGVEYLDSGWQTLVDELEKTTRLANVTVATGITVNTIERRGSGYEVIAEGQRWSADLVVMAVGPQTCRSLLPWSAAIAEAAQAAIPVRAACLDVVLDALPNPSHLFTLGLDRPHYLSVHGAFARLGPAGSFVVHVAKYLATNETDDHVRDELEALLERAQPSWTKHAIYTRYLPQMTVYSAMPLASRGGLRGRTPVVVADAPNVLLAGDWVGDEGLLLDAALASAARVGDLSQRERRVA